jgi:MFS family permease
MLPHDPYAALRIPNFRLYIASLLTLTLGIQIQGVVVAWQIYEVTHDPLSLGLIGLAEAVPFIAIALYAGHVADRLDRRRVTMASSAVLFFCSLALLGLTLVPPWLARGRVWPIYVVIFVSGIARSFLQPARTAFGAELVPRDIYPNAITWRSSSWQLAAVVGPALGGLLYAFAGARFAYAVDAALVLVAVIGILHISHTSVRRVGTHAPSTIESLKTGLRFVRGNPILLGALTLDLFAVLFGGAVALLPIFADDILHAGPQGLGLLRAAPAVGAVAVSLILAHRPPFRHTGRALLGSVALFGLCMIAFGLSRSFELSLAVLTLSGGADMVSVVVRSTLLQVLTPEPLLGRVSSVNAIFIGSSNEIGAFESGLAAKLLGTVTAVVLGGLATLGVVAVIARTVPELRKLGAIKAQH